MKNKRKRILTILAVFFSFVLIGLIAIGNYLVNFAIVRTDSYTDVTPASIVSEENVSIIKQNRMVMVTVQPMTNHLADWSWKKE